MEVVLASRSPRRRMLLLAAGLAVEVRPSDAPEEARPGESAHQQVARLAMEKAAWIREAERPVIAADTLVCLDDEVLGKPANLDDARAMLKRLAGRWHEVHTGVCVRLGGALDARVVTTHVHFRPLSEREIDTYLAHNEVLDKAGAYAVQAGASSFIDEIRGPLDNVIGLPVPTTLELLAAVTGARP